MSLDSSDQNLDYDLESLFETSVPTMSSPTATRAPVRGGRKIHKHNANTATVTQDGEISERDAQRALTDAMEEWGVQGNSDSVLDPVLGNIAQCLRKGTSAERDFSKVSFTIGNTTMYLDVLLNEVKKYNNTENPMRIWVRSYNGGEIALRIHDMLKDPENVALRQVAATDYECSMDVVHLAFDTADVLPGIEDLHLSQLERMVIKANVARKAKSSRSAFNGGSEGGSAQNAAAHTAAVAAAPAIAPTIASSSEAGSRARANFAAVRA